MYALRGMGYRIVLQKNSLILLPIDDFGHVYKNKPKKYIPFDQIARMDIEPAGIIPGKVNIVFHESVKTKSIFDKELLILYSKSEQDHFTTLMLYWDGYIKNNPLDFDTLLLHKEQYMEETAVNSRRTINKRILLSFFIVFIILVITLLVKKYLG